jgi:hypothetical protein
LEWFKWCLKRVERAARSWTTLAAHHCITYASVEQGAVAAAALPRSAAADVCGRLSCCTVKKRYKIAQEYIYIYIYMYVVVVCFIAT